MGTELIEALRAADAHLPSALEIFDRIVASREPVPDLYEQSLRLAVPSSPYRLTYYFDVHRRGTAVAHEAGERFVRLAEELGLALPSALAAFVQSEGPCGEEVLQVVLGVEIPADGASAKGKYYLVFRANPGRCVRDLFARLELTPVTGTDPERVYIVGADVTCTGLDDLKVYYRLEVGRVAALVENAHEVASLLTATKDVVFQQCTRRPQRRQLYFHVRRTETLSEWLAEQGLDEALARKTSINAHLRGRRLDPWIVSMAYEQRRVDLHSGNVYFHLG